MFYIVSELYKKANSDFHKTRAVLQLYDGGVAQIPLAISQGSRGRGPVVTSIVSFLECFCFAGASVDGVSKDSWSRTARLLLRRREAVLTASFDDVLPKEEANAAESGVRRVGRLSGHHIRNGVSRKAASLHLLRGDETMLRQFAARGAEDLPRASAHRCCGGPARFARAPRHAFLVFGLQFTARVVKAVRRPLDFSRRSRLASGRNWIAQSIASPRSARFR